MNWVEQEYLAVAEANNPDVWLLTAPMYKACEHRWKTRANPAPPIACGFYRLYSISVCTRCGAEA